MPPQNLSWSIFGRPVKPVALVLMNTMLVLAFVAWVDIGVLGNSIWADILGLFAFSIAVVFGLAWFKKSQTLAEWALTGAFFVWGFRFWAILLVRGESAFTSEGWYLAFLWTVLAGGSWLLERSDPKAQKKIEGDERWTQL